jgi:uncharacterized protein (TIGR00725 family)
MAFSRERWVILHDREGDLQPEAFVTADSIHCTPISARAPSVREMRPKIGVIGSAGEAEASITAKAREVGKEIARHDAILLTGASTGLSYEAVKGAREVGGFTMGISPASSLREHEQRYRLSVDPFDLLVFAGFGFKGGNVVFVRSCDAVVAVAGRRGNLNEFKIAYDEHRPVGVLKVSGGISNYLKTIVEKSEKEGPEVVYDADPSSLVDQLLGVLKKDRSPRPAHRPI